MRADGHERFPPHEPWAELKVDKMIKFIACNNTLLPGFTAICAFCNTDTVVINQHGENSMTPDLP
jgi:hypothetical protein